MKGSRVSEPFLLGDYAGAFDIVEFGEAGFEPCVAFGEEGVLFAAADASAGVFAISVVQGVGNLHAFDDPGEGDEGFFVVGGAVVAEVDEHLGGATVGVFEGIGDGAAGIGEDSGVVGYVLVAPGAGDLSVCGYAELRPVLPADAEDGRVVIVAIADEVVEAVDSVGGPFSFYFEENIAFCRLKLYAEFGRGLGAEDRVFGVEEAAVS